ncbi:hypothetical protein RF11_13144 [Thelohanellus kitauei]|uniref:Uncharacterized protein n=1 Tax=Thelohanellus kitauei TaxID=669202 RepID=A0A0C2NAP8_THEKT|nr:hypothetical protein RF11_13144 [Thelohanellus kitauei]
MKTFGLESLINVSNPIQEVKDSTFKTTMKSDLFDMVVKFNMKTVNNFQEISHICVDVQFHLTLAVLFEHDKQHRTALIIVGLIMSILFLIIAASIGYVIYKRRKTNMLILKHIIDASNSNITA